MSTKHIPSVYVVRVVLENSNVAKLASTQYLVVHSLPQADRYDTDDASARELYPILVPNPSCAWFNRPGTGYIVHRSWTGKATHIERLHCTVCGRVFSKRAGTLMAWSKLPMETVERWSQGQQWGVSDEVTVHVVKT